MTEESQQKAFRERLIALCPIIDHLRGRLGAARHSSNRNRAVELEELARIQDQATLDLNLVFEQVETDLQKKPEACRPPLLRLQRILTHLEIIAANITATANPILQKIKRGVVFGDKDFFQVNQLFTQLTGFMRGLTDLFHHPEDFLIRDYLLTEWKNVVDGCFAAATDHEARMMDGFGQPEGWAV